MTPEVLALVRPGDLWGADRNFCTTALLFGIADRRGSFVIRQHGSTLTWEATGPRQTRGRCDTGEVFKQPVRLTDPEGRRSRCGESPSCWTGRPATATARSTSSPTCPRRWPTPSRWPR